MKRHIVLGALVLISVNSIRPVNRLMPLVQLYAHSSKASLITFGLFLFKEIAYVYKKDYSNITCDTDTEEMFKLKLMNRIVVSMWRALQPTLTTKALSLALGESKDSYTFKSVFPYAFTLIVYHCHNHNHSYHVQSNEYQRNKILQNSSDLFKALMIYLVLIRK